MAVPFIKNSYVTGEIAPALFGRTDLEKYASAASTMRNMFVDYRGGAKSRPGTAFLGYSKQTGRNYPPRLIPFQFDINQGLALEFGNGYMRVLSDGAYVTESALNITGATNTSPAAVSAGATGAETATANNSLVSSSYAPGDDITLAGGTGTVPAVLGVTNTTLVSVQPNAPFSGYAPGDTINLSGGTQTSPAQVQVTHTQLSATPTIVSAGSGGTVGSVTLTGTTGTGTKFQLLGTIGNSLTAAPVTTGVTASYAPNDSITLAGGTFTSPAVLNVTLTKLVSLTETSAGTGYAPTNTITLAGGLVSGGEPVVTVSTTKVVGTPGIAAAGTGGTTGTQTVTGTTGTGTKFQASVTVSGGGITAVLSLTVAGSYTVNPTTLTNEPVTGGGLTGAALSIVMGVNTFTNTTGGNFSANPTSGLFTQGSTSGSGNGATFTGIFGPEAVSVTSPGSYSALPSNPVSQASTTGSGVGATFNLTSTNGLTAISSISVGGNYTVNPTTLTNEPVTGGGLTGATVSVVMGILTITISEAGVFTANAPGGTFTQASTSGSGVGAAFSFGVFGPNTLSVVTAGTYSTFPSNPVSQASTTGLGLGATFTLTSGAGAPYNNGDWVYIEGVGGMTQLNGRSFVVGGASSTGFSLYDVFGNAIDSTSYGSYTSGGTAARIYTLTTPYGEADLPYLKFTQSADVMSLTCWNQQTLTEYEPLDLTRFSDNDWQLALPVFFSTIAAPTNLAGVQQGSNQQEAVYFINYAVTAVGGALGQESLPTPEIIVGNETLGAANSSGTVPTNILSWTAVPGALYYNIYAEEPIPDQTGWVTVPPPTGIMGFIGQTTATSYTDRGYSPDFSKGPPQHANPFARGQIIAGSVVSGGKNYVFGAGAISRSYQSQIYSTIGTSTGAGGVVIPVVNSNATTIGSLYVQNPGAGYSDGDTVAIYGSGTGATGTLTIGPESGTYPGCVAYFQERRVYASSQNNPDTYWMSQNGLYLNFDTHFPVVADDAITGTPWAVQVNGIQWMVDMPGGLVVLTGLGAWQLTGAGGSSLNPVPITPAAQQAQPQAFNGASATVPPIKIDSQILYVQAKGSIVREFSYQYFQNIYTGVDLTEISSQLFTGFTILQWAYTEEPNKIIWAVRNDGILLSLTYLKAEQVQSWARHDTNGMFVSCCSVTEPPVDALYVATQRTIAGATSYMIERMDNGIWPTAEESWCVDAGLQYPLNYPAATLSVSSPVGNGTCLGVVDLVGGQNYGANTYAVTTDANGQGIGTGAVANLTISGGQITGVSFSPGGTFYSYPTISFVDPSNKGSGASATIVLDNSATFTASSPVFSIGNVGDIIRVGGGIAEITAYIDSQDVTANILVPISACYPNSATASSLPTVIPQPSESWSMTAPITTVTGLWHLVGALVTGIADGNAILPRPVQTDGSIALSAPASAITIGLGFTSQVQGVYFDAGQGAASQGRRKKVAAVTARIEASKGISVGTNQPDGSTSSPPQIAPAWSNLVPLPDLRTMTFNGLTTPLYTGDSRVPVPSDFDTRGQVAFQQSNPFPMNILATVSEIVEGDVEIGDKGGSQPAGGGANALAGTGFYFNFLNTPPYVIFIAPPSVVFLDVETEFNGTVNLSGAAVRLAYGTSNVTPPNSGWVSATVTGGTWTCDITNSTLGNAYLWAQQTDDQPIFSVILITCNVATLIQSANNGYSNPVNRSAQLASTPSARNLVIEVFGSDYEQPQDSTFPTGCHSAINFEGIPTSEGVGSYNFAIVYWTPDGTTNPVMALPGSPTTNNMVLQIYEFSGVGNLITSNTATISCVSGGPYGYTASIDISSVPAGSLVIFGAQMAYPGFTEVWVPIAGFRTGTAFIDGVNGPDYTHIYCSGHGISDGTTTLQFQSQQNINGLRACWAAFAG